MWNGQRNGERFEQNSARVNGFEFTNIDISNSYTMVVLRQDQPLLLKHSQCLPERGAAHTNFLRKLHLGKHRSRRNSPVENHLSQVHMHLRRSNFSLSRINWLEFHANNLQKHR